MKESDLDIVSDIKLMKIDQRLSLIFPYSLDLVYFLVLEVIPNAELKKIQGLEKIIVKE